MRTHKFRLYPNKKQEVILLEQIDLCRETYNILLGELQAQQEIDKSQIQGTIPDLKICDSRFKKVYSKALQYECYKLFSNLRALSRLKEEGYKVGQLRFKGKGSFKTMTYNQSGFKLVNKKGWCQILELSKIGNIAIRCHNTIAGTIKQVTIKKYCSGKWYASLVEDTTNPQPISHLQIKNTVGIDVGLQNLIYDSEGRFIENPRQLTEMPRIRLPIRSKLRGIRRIRRFAIGISEIPTWVCVRSRAAGYKTQIGIKQIFQTTC